MGSYSAVCSRGLGRLEYFVQVEGLKYVPSTTATEPTDAWFTGGGGADPDYTILTGLRADTIRRVCAARPGEVWPDLSGFDLEIDDATGALSAYLVGLDGATTTELTATLAAAGATITVASTAAFASSGEVHVDRECVKYTGKNATQFTGCTRGHHGSVDVEHAYSASLWPPCVPIVSTTPDGLRGRRVAIYVAERAPTGTLSASTCIWIGVIEGSERWIGCSCSIPVRHVLGAFQSGEVAGWLPSARVRGLYVPNTDGNRWGRLVVNDANNGDQTLDLVTDGTASYYDSASELVNALVAAVPGGLTDWDAGVTGDGHVYLVCNGSAPVGAYSTPCIQISGQLAMLLGFAMPGDGAQQIWARDFGERILAPALPATSFAVLNPTGYSVEPRVYVGTGEAQLFFESLLSITYDGSTWMLEVDSIDTTDDYLVVRPCFDFVRQEVPEVIMTLGAGAPAQVRQILGLKSFKLHDVVRVLWSGTLYSGALPFTLPRRLLPEPCLRDGDVDWDSLEAICTSAPEAASRMFMVIDEATPVEDLLTGPLFACGAYAYVNDDGTVSWKRVGPPMAVDITTTIDGAYLDGRRCVDIETERSRDRVINAVSFEVGTALETEPFKVYVADTTSMQRYGARPARLSDVTESVRLDVALSTYYQGEQVSQELSRHLAGALRFLGRELARVRLPVTIKARAIDIGDTVYLTTPWVRDTATGAQGVTQKVAVVMGWERAEGASGAIDWLDLALIDQPAGAISPAALCTSSDGAESLEFADTDLYHREGDASDLSYFEVGDKIVLVEYDADAPGTWSATVAAVDVAGGTLAIDRRPVGLVIPCIVRFAAHEDCVADQIDEGWVWGADADDGLIQDDPAGTRWS